MGENGLNFYIYIFFRIWWVIWFNRSFCFYLNIFFFILDIFFFFGKFNNLIGFASTFKHRETAPLKKHYPRKGRLRATLCGK